MAIYFYDNDKLYTRRQCTERQLNCYPNVFRYPSQRKHESSHWSNSASLDILLFSISMLKVYMKGFRAEFSGNTKMAKATFTSPGMGMSARASNPHRPMGNQHRKSVTGTDISRLAMVSVS